MLFRQWQFLNRQRWFDVAQRCEFHRWRTQLCFNVDLTLFGLVMSHQSNGNVEITFKFLLGLDDLKRYIFDLKNNLSRFKVRLLNSRVIYKSLEMKILNCLKDSWQWNEDALLTNSILRKNVCKFCIFLQELLVMVLNQTSKIVVIKLNRHKEIRRILLNESELKNQKSESVKLHGGKKAFINESLFCTTRNCGPNVKSCGMLITLPCFRPAMDCWESTCLNKSLSTITHDCDLEKLFSGNPLIEDNYSLIAFNISCCNNMCSWLSLLLDISFKTGCFEWYIQ